MQGYIVVLISLLHCAKADVIETDDGNVTLSSVTVSISPTTTYYNLFTGSSLYISCSANCNPPCDYRWYHANYQTNGSVLNIPSVTKDMDYLLHGPLMCFAFNDDIGPFSSPEIRLYIHDYRLLPETNYINIEEGRQLDVTVNCSACSGRLRRPGSRYSNGNTHSFIMDRRDAGQWQWRIYSHGQYNYHDLTVNVYITSPEHVLKPDIRNLSLDTSRCDQREIGPIRFIGRCSSKCDYVWYKNGQFFSAGNTLYITNVNRNDSGEYQCFAYNSTDDVASEKIFIEVDDSKRIILVSPMQKQFQHEIGESLGPIKCFSSNVSSDNNSIYWETPSGQNMYNETLWIASLTLADFGKYTCSEAYVTKSACRDITVLVIKINSSTSNGCLEKAVSFEDFTMKNYSLNVSLSTVEFVSWVIEGSSLTLTCNAICNPPCNYYRWYYLGGMQEGRTLHLQNIDRTMDYEFGKALYCIAWNECTGRHSSPDVYLDVLCMLIC